MIDYREAAAALRSRADAGEKVGGSPADDAAIAAAEARLGVSFPESYRAFLRDFGWGGVSSWECFGAGQRVPDHLNVVAMTEERRAILVPPLPRHMVAVMEPGNGDVYCLDTSQLRDGECSVIWWSHEEGPDQEPMEMAASFGALILEQVNATAAGQPHDGDGRSSADLEQFVRDQATALQSFLRMLPPELREQYHNPTSRAHGTDER